MRVQRRDLATWEDVRRESDLFSDRHWIYRGVPDVCHAELKPSLERCKDYYGILAESLLYVEGGLIRRFKRNYYHYSGDAPGKEDYAEWLALMRHHGAPTRLLDWTYSFFIALFFALERSKTPAVVWALHAGNLDEQLKDHRFGDLYLTLNRSRNVDSLAAFKGTFGSEPPLTFVSTLNPYRLNQRLTVQQGTFLAQGNLTLSFEDNLAATIGGTPPDSVMLQFVIDNDRTFRRQLQRRLYRMGINRAALFPGLDGFAQSLEQLLNFPQRICPPDSGFTSYEPPKLA